MDVSLFSALPAAAVNPEDNGDEPSGFLGGGVDIEGLSRLGSACVRHIGLGRGERGGGFGGEDAGEGGEEREGEKGAHGDKEEIVE